MDSVINGTSSKIRVCQMLSFYMTIQDELYTITNLMKVINLNES